MPGEHGQDGAHRGVDLELHVERDPAGCRFGHLGQRGRLARRHALTQLRVVQARDQPAHAADAGVVHDDQVPITGHPDVELDNVGAERDRCLQGGERVLRRVAPCAAVRDDQRARGAVGTGQVVIPVNWPPVMLST